MPTEYLTDENDEYVRTIGPSRPTSDEYDEALSNMNLWARAVADDAIDGQEDDVLLEGHRDMYRAARQTYRIMSAAYFHSTHVTYGAAQLIPVELPEPPVDPASLTETDCCQ